jgi:putative ABC transport system permease protein
VSSNLTAIAAALEEEYKDDNLGRGMWAQTLYAWVVGDVQSPLLVLLGAVGVVLLIACVNVANLLFARSAAREHEVSVRVAMGAGRGALIRQFLIESSMLALLGGAVGLALAFWGAKALVALSPESLPRLGNVGLDARVLGFTLVASLVTGVIFGLLPALTASKPDLLSPLKEGGRGATSRRKKRLRRFLVISEVAMAVVLLVSAGLLMKSFWRLLQVDPGFSATNVVTVGIQLPASRYPQEFSTFPRWTKVRTFHQELLQRVKAVSGVDYAALAYNIPTDAGWTTRFTIDGRAEVDPGEQDEVRIRPVSAEYFRTVGIPVLKGRPFEERDDRTDAPPVILINEAFAHRYFQDEDPIGARVTLWNVSREIVGIAKDVKFRGLDQDVPPALYATFSQMPFTGFSLLARTSHESNEMLARIRDEIWSLDRDLALSNLSTLEETLSRTTAQPRFNMILLGLFATVAILLAAVGIYGVMSYGVNQRTREIGVRISVGASKADVIRQVLAEGLKLSGFGVLLGVAGAFAATRILESLLFGVGTLDPATFALVCVMSVCVGMAASLIPARRASRVDPVVALRYE